MTFKPVGEVNEVAAVVGEELVSEEGSALSDGQHYRVELVSGGLFRRSGVDDHPQKGVGGGGDGMGDGHSGPVSTGRQGLTGGGVGGGGDANVSGVRTGGPPGVEGEGNGFPLVERRNFALGKNFLIDGPVVIEVGVFNLQSCQVEIAGRDLPVLSAPLDAVIVPEEGEGVRSGAVPHGEVAVFDQVEDALRIVESSGVSLGTGISLGSLWNFYCGSLFAALEGNLDISFGVSGGLGNLTALPGIAFGAGGAGVTLISFETGGGTFPLSLVVDNGLSADFDLFHVDDSALDVLGVLGGVGQQSVGNGD